MPSLLLMLLLLLPPIGPPTEGELRVVGDTGLAVLVDGMEYGKTIAGGLVVPLPAGAHSVTIRSANGEENNFSVNIVAGQTADIRVSALGLRRALKRPQNGSILLRGASQCKAAAAGQSSEKSDEGLVIRAIPVGSSQVSVMCGGRTAHAEVTIRAGILSTLELDQKTMSLRRTGEERLSLAVDVPDSSVITRSSLPGAWKRSLSRVTTSGVAVESVSQMTTTQVVLRARAATENALYSYRWAIGEAEGIRAVTSYKLYRYGSNYVLEMLVTMEPPE